MKIVIDNKYLTIKDFDRDVLKFINKHFKVQKTGSGFTRQAGVMVYNAQRVKKINLYDYDPDTNSLIFLNGAWDFLKNKKQFKKILEEKKPKIIDKRELISFDNFTDDEIKNVFKDYGVVLRDMQIKFFKEFPLKKQRNILVEAPTGSGKTILFLAILKLLNIPAIITGKEKQNVNKNYKVAIEKLGFSKKETGFFTNAKYTQKKKYQFCTIGMINKIPNLEDYKLLIVDEVHEASSNTYQKFFIEKCNVPVFGFSGTPLKKQKEHKMKLLQVFGDVWELDKTDNLIEKDELAIPIFILYENFDDDVFEEFQEAYTNLANEIITKGIVNNKSRNKKAVNLASNLYKKGEKVLILTQRVEHGEFIVEKLNEKLNLKTQFISGKDKIEKRDEEMNKFEQAEGQALLVMSSIGDVGMDLPTMNHLIILSSGKAEWLVKQRLGRALRKTKNKEKKYIHDFLDTEHKILQKWSEERINVYKKIKNGKVKIIHL